MGEAGRSDVPVRSLTASKASQESVDSFLMPCEASNPIPSMSAIQEAEEAPLENMKVKAQKKKVKLEDAGEQSNCEHAKEAMKKACKKDKKKDKQGEKEKERKLEKASKAAKKDKEEPNLDRASKASEKDKDAGEQSNCEHAKEAMKKACKKDKKKDKQ